MSPLQEFWQLMLAVEEDEIETDTRPEEGFIIDHSGEEVFDLPSYWGYWGHESSKVKE